MKKRYAALMGKMVLDERMSGRRMCAAAIESIQNAVESVLSHGNPGVNFKHNPKK